VIDGPVSFLYAGLLGLLLLVQAFRAQAAVVDYLPFAVLLLVVAEVRGLEAWAIHAAGILLVASRVPLAFDLARGPGATGRSYGAAGIWIVIAGLSLWLVWATTAASRSPAPA
jgi:uncharacterized membrane protein YecN with MAPEG domain